jgi:cell division FtsZ-interacting protein ZapD
MLTKLAAKKQQLRQYNAFNAIDSARIEGIALTEQLQKSLSDYISGKKSIAELIKEAKQRYAVNLIR